MNKFLLIILTFFSLSAFGREKLLLIDGKNSYHNWQETSQQLINILESDFEVVRMTHSEAEWQSKDVEFSSYKAVLLNYWGKWPDPLFAKFESYIKNGGGMVTFHSALASFPGKKQFAEMVGLKWQNKDQGNRIYLDDSLKLVTDAKGVGDGCGHSSQHEFDIRATTHSLFKKQVESNPRHNKDEMYHALRGPAKNLSIQGFSKSPNTKKNEPLIWTVNYGKGRSYVTALGHSGAAMKSEVFSKTMLHGTAWAAGVKISGSSSAKPKTQLSLTKKRVRPSREVISKHTDNSVTVLGKYSLVKLPIKTGVKIWNPTAVVRDGNDLMWVANYTGEIYSLHDTNGDGLEDHAELFCDVKEEKLRYPTCMAWQKGELYVGTTQEIRAYKDTDGDLKADSSRVYFKDFPWTLHYWDWTFALEFGADGQAYVIFCTDYLNGGRAKDPKKYRGAIVKISPDGKKSEIFASGARFAYGMAFNQHGDLFFTDNKSGGNPTEELNFAEQGKFYGHNTHKYPGQETTGPLVKIKHGYGSGGLEFNDLSNDFGGTAGNLFQVCWGPDGKWNKGSLVRIELAKQSDGSYKAKEHLVAKDFPKIIDAKFSKAGDLYIAQFGKEGRAHTPYARPEGGVYRMIYTKWRKEPIYQNVLTTPLIVGDLSKGEKTFKARCALCHDSDSLADVKLGPPLKGIGNMFNRSEFITAIKEPSRGIKTDYESHEIIKKDGTKLLGRLVSIDEEGFNMMIVGNAVITIKKSDVKSKKMLDASLMPEGMLNGLSDSEIDNLLAYMKIRMTNITKLAKASSPDGLDDDGSSGGAQAAIDGNAGTFWDEVDNKSGYILQLEFKETHAIRQLVIAGHGHHFFSPQDFDVVADGKVILSIKDAKYQSGVIKLQLPVTKCRVLQLKISKAYGPSPAIRELEVYE